MTFKQKILLAFVVGLAVFIRLYQVESIPPCLNWDEAAFGYNAFSILETGKDEYGTPFPIQFKSIGDYKLPVYIYLMVPVIKLFGLSSFSVRFLPAFLGALSTIPMYFISKRILKSHQLALLAAFFLSISPWHIQFTRAGADVGVSTFFTISGVYFLLRAIEVKNTNFYLTAVFFAASLYTYFSDRVFVPLFIIATSLYFRKSVVKKLKKAARAGMLGLILLTPLLLTALSSGQQGKLVNTTVLGQARSEEYVDDLARDDAEVEMSVFHSKIYEQTLGIVDHYITHFSPEFLISKGAGFDLRQLIYKMGVIYIYDLPLIILGILALRKGNKKYFGFVMLWLLIAPIPSAITRDAVHARRSINMVYPVLILSSAGAGSFMLWIKKLKLKYKFLILATTLGFVAFNILFYIMSYFVFTPKRVLKGPAGFNCGHRELVEYINTLDKNYDNIVVDPAYQGPYLYFLFYNKYPPEKYQSQAELIKSSPESLGEGARIDNIEFRSIYWPDDRGLKNTLFAGPPDRLPTKDVEETGEIINKIYFYNGEPAYVVVQTPPEE